MSKNIQTLSKWIPIEIKEYDNLFNICIEVETDCLNLIQRILVLLKHLQSYSKCFYINNSPIENEQQIQEIENIALSIETLVTRFKSTFQELRMDKSKNKLLQDKIKMFRMKLCTIKMKICYVVQEFITEVAYLFIYYGEHILELTLKISASFNTLNAFKYDLLNDSTSILCNNTCPYLMFPLRKITVTKLLQILALNRAEICCHKLIDCLLETYKAYERNNLEDEDGSNSDTSSMEIYMALTKHMPETPPHRTTQEKHLSPDDNITEINNFMNLEELIVYEEKNVVDLLEATLKTQPQLLGNDVIKKSNPPRIRSKAKKKVLLYYEQILWGEVGNFLEHIVLWWTNAPLSHRSPSSSQHLREWIYEFIQNSSLEQIEAPSVVLTALVCLADALGVHVTTTLWDKQFRLALVSNCSTKTGQLYANVLYDLVHLSNACEVTPDWIMGAPLDELPLVEQIPILHRLDHSIHTTRLWALNETKKIANNWNVKDFFSITHTDIVTCITNLNNLKLANHEVEIEKGGLGVHVEVCSLMRAKLASEVAVNAQKLKDSPKECVDCLASICRTISLANLQMIFPPADYWRRTTNVQVFEASPFVDKFMDQILLPVLNSIHDQTICNMILKLMCESWLDYIYTQKIKFTSNGAKQLLCDFDHITTWINSKEKLNEEIRKKLLKNEILRRCEGVGRLLLRNPGERITMNDKYERKLSIARENSSETNNDLMPAEMYVPNQEQWLELRAVKRRYLIFNAPLCCNNT